MGPVKSRWLVVCILVLFCGLLIWWGRRAGAPESKASPGPVAPSAGEATPPSPKPVSWHVVVDSLALVPAPGLVAKMPAKLLLEGTPTGAPCHYRMNLYAGMNQMTAKEGELKPGESLEVPPGTETVAVQLDGVGKEGKPLRFRSIWRQAPRPHLEVVNGVAFILGTDGILRRLDLVKNPQGEPTVIPGIESMRFRSFSYLWIDSFRDCLWGLRDDNALVALSAESFAQKQRGGRPEPLLLYEFGNPLPVHPGWEVGPFQVCRLPICRDEVLAVAPGAADIVGLALRNIQGDGKATVLTADGRLSTLATRGGQQFQPVSLEGNPFLVHLGGRWVQDKGGCRWNGTENGYEEHWQCGNRLAGLVDFSGQIHGISERTEVPEMGPTEEFGPDLRTTIEKYSSPAGIVACDEASGLSFDRQGGWSWDGQPVRYAPVKETMAKQPLKLDPALEGVVVRKLQVFPIPTGIFALRPTPFRLLCLDAEGVVRMLNIANGRVVQERAWKEPWVVDIAVARLGRNMPGDAVRLGLPSLWALTAEGRPVCLDPKEAPQGDFQKACQVREVESITRPPSTRLNSLALTADVLPGLCSAIPAQVTISAKNQTLPIAYKVSAFHGLAILEKKAGVLASGETLVFPAGATAVALEMSQADEKRRLLWTLDNQPESYPYPIPYDNEQQGLQVVLDPETVWQLDPKVLKLLVQAGLGSPAPEVSVPLEGRALWIPRPNTAGYRKREEIGTALLLEKMAPLLAPRTVLRHSRTGRFFQLGDGSLYGYDEQANALCQMPGWGAELRPASWNGQYLLDSTGRLLRALASSYPSNSPLESQSVHCFSYSQEQIPSPKVVVKVPRARRTEVPPPENAFLVGHTLAGWIDAEGNHWVWSQQFHEATPRWMNLGPIPPGVADIAWIAYENKGRPAREEQLVQLMEDGSMIVLFPDGGQFKRIRIEGTSWKKPGPP